MKILNGQILLGNSLIKLKEIKDQSVQSVITSPPYWALRDYGVDNQIGLEKNFEDYLNNLMKIFRETKRILKKDGLLFINIADTYSGTGSKKSYLDPLNPKGRNGQEIAVNNKVNGIKKKSLIGIPQRLQILLINDGWICRNVIIWKKPNAMPESVKDRFTNDFEYIFMFSKNSKYKFNQIKEIMKTNDLSSPRGSKGIIGNKNKGLRNYEKSDQKYSEGNYRIIPKDGMRNKRSVWSINTKPFREAHFATFPEELIENLLLCSTDKNDIVLDPFMGSGTVAKVAENNNRKWIGIELNEEYIQILKKRVNNIQGKLF